MGEDGGMSVLRTLGQTLGTTARAVRGVTTGGFRAGRFVGRNVGVARRRGAAGETGMLRLLDLHAASCAGDTLIALGLANTIFFAAPVGEARGQVALYLLATMLPFALLAPIVGPALDRFRHGRRYALATTFLGRAFLAYLLFEHVDGLALYPAAFGVLVLSRAYGVARSAAVPRLLPPGLGLSEAGARASVFGTFAGALALPIGLAAAALSTRGPLLLATLPFVFGMVTALRLPPKADSDPPETVPRPLQWLAGKGAKVLSGRLVVAALTGSASLRALYGFLLLFLAFSIRSGDLPTRLFGFDLSQAAAIGMLALALGLGSFLATAIGTKLRIRRPALLQGIGLFVVAATAIGAVGQHTLAAVAALCLAVATASGLAKLATDAVIQERVDEQVRASAFAHSETLLMIAWVVGGAVGLVPFGSRWGLIVAAAFAVLAATRAVLAAAALRGERLQGRPITDPISGTATEATTVPTPARPQPQKPHLRPTVAERMQPKKRQVFSWRKPPKEPLPPVPTRRLPPQEATTVPAPPPPDDEPVGYTLYQPTRKLDDSGTPQ
jgi:MFS family permease